MYEVVTKIDNTIGELKSNYHSVSSLEENEEVISYKFPKGNNATTNPLDFKDI